MSSHMVAFARLSVGTATLILLNAGKSENFWNFLSSYLASFVSFSNFWSFLSTYLASSQFRE